MNAPLPTPRASRRSPPALRRARPLLGTLVDMRIEGLAPARAERAAERAFAEVAAIHRLMSFHAAGSDLDRLHRARRGAWVRVDARTRVVLELALRVAADSQGRFDPTVAAQQVAWGLLPRPIGSAAPHPQASWRDIELDGSRGVRLLRPLWIDLGGIAKGHAVDRAVEIIVGSGAAQVCVNAGGDLRVAGSRPELVHLRAAVVEPLVEIGNAAVATSVGARAGRAGNRHAGPHVDGVSRLAAGRAGESVSVVAPDCSVADALTKVVLACRDELARRVLERYGAQACVRAAGLRTIQVDAA